MLKLKEVCEITKLSKSTIYEYIKKGMFPKSVKLTERSSRWCEADIMQWLNEKITGGIHVK